MAFSVKSKWNGGFSVGTTASKGFRMGGQSIDRQTEYNTQYDFPAQLSGEGQGPTVCEGCMGALAACLTQTMVAHATSRGIQLDNIEIQVEGEVDMIIIIFDFYLLLVPIEVVFCLSYMM